MDRPQPPLTCYPCNPRTTQDFSGALRTRTVFKAGGANKLASALLPQRATPTEASSPRTFRTATTASRIRQHAALNARRSTGVVNA